MADYINLLEELKDVLAKNNRTLEEVKWYGTMFYEIQGDIKTFLDVSYEDYKNKIPCNLIIEGDNWRVKMIKPKEWAYAEIPDRDTTNETDIKDSFLNTGYL